jgi:hypothetical protein
MKAKVTVEEELKADGSELELNSGNIGTTMNFG